MPESHDPIREWHAQKERAELVLDVCAQVCIGELPPSVATVALLTAGVDADQVASLGGPFERAAQGEARPPAAAHDGLTITLRGGGPITASGGLGGSAEAPRDAQPERAASTSTDPLDWLSTAAAEIDRLARAGTRCLVAGNGPLNGLAIDAMLAIGWTWSPALRELVNGSGIPIRVARSVDACRGPNVGAVWLVGASPEIRKQASRVLCQPPGVMLVTPAKPAVEPVLPPGCRLERWITFPPWGVVGRDGQPVVEPSSTEDSAARKAWERFGAFMSREDYEALVEAASATQRARADRDNWRANGDSWKADSAAAHAEVERLRAIVRAADTLSKEAGRRADGETERAAKALDRAAAAERRTEAYRAEISRLTDTIQRLRAEFAGPHPEHARLHHALDLCGPAAGLSSEALATRIDRMRESLGAVQAERERLADRMRSIADGLADPNGVH